MDQSDGSRYAERLQDIVARRMLNAPDARLRQVSERILRLAHGIVAEFGISERELRNAIEWLTEVGHVCGPQRQEWVLLADVFGLTAHATDLAHPTSRGATPMTTRGPFYRANAPHRNSGDTISLDGEGMPLHVTGRVVGSDGVALAGAQVESWQANAAGLYENQAPDLQPEFNLRGTFTADAQGFVRYWTVQPGRCELPTGGPVRRLMADLEMPQVVPAHISFRIVANGYRTLVTHLFDSDDPFIEEDALFGVKPELLVKFRQNEGDDHRNMEFEFVLIPIAPLRAACQRERE